MTKIHELIEDFKLDQEILGREKKYVDLCLFRLYRWERFTVKELGVPEAEEVTQLHIKKYIQERQRVGKEVNRTINNNIATLKVFPNTWLVRNLLMSRITPCGGLRTNLKEEKTVIV